MQPAYFLMDSVLMEAQFSHSLNVKVYLTPSVRGTQIHTVIQFGNNGVFPTNIVHGCCETA